MMQIHIVCKISIECFLPKPTTLKQLKIAHNLLSNPGDKQTNQPTNKPRQKHNRLGGGKH